MATPIRIARENKWGDSSRFYELPNGEHYPSVTTILSVIGKPALINWAAKVEREMVLKVSADLYEDCPQEKMSRTAWITTMQSRLTKEKAHQKEMTKAGEIGSQVHSLIEWTLKASLMQEVGHPPKISDRAQWGFMAWEDWKKSVNLKPILIEQTVYSQMHCYAGTLDMLAEVNGKLTVVDWKTGKAVYAEAHLQNAAYRHALREMGHGDPVSGLVVRLPKVETDPEFEVVEAMPEEMCMTAFLNAIKLWTWVQGREAERNAIPKESADKTQG